VIIKVVDLTEGTSDEHTVNLYARVCGLNPNDTVAFIKRPMGTEEYWYSGNFDTCEVFPVPQHSDVVEIYNDVSAFLCDKGYLPCDAEAPVSAEYLYAVYEPVSVLGALTSGGAYVELLGRDCDKKQCTFVVGDSWHTWVPDVRIIKARRVDVGHITLQPDNVFKYAMGADVDAEGNHYVRYAVPFAKEWFNLCVMRENRRVCGTTPIWNGTIVYKTLAYAPRSNRYYLTEDRINHDWAYPP